MFGENKRQSMISLKAICAWSILLLFIGIDAEARYRDVYYEFQGNKRKILLYEGNFSSEDKVPLILVFHGYGGTAESIQRSFKIENHWPNALVAYVQGLVIPRRSDGRAKPGTEKTGWQRSLGMDKDRDLKFVDYLIKSLSEEFDVDKTRIYAAGFSNGAVFTWVLVATRPHTFAAFAPIGGIDNGVLERATVPKPVIFHFGRNDKAFKLAWAQKSIRRMKKLNKISRAGIKRPNNYILLEPDIGGRQFVLNVHDGGHEIPRYASRNICIFFKSQVLN